MLKSFRIEDWMALATLASFAFLCACVFLSVENGAGKHLLAVNFADLPNALMARWLGEIAYILTSVFLKFTVGIFLLRICSHRWQTTVIWAVLAIVSMFNIVYLFIAISQCQPVDYFWNRVSSLGAKGSCVSKELASGSTYAATAVNAFADWTLGLLPIALVWNLELNSRTKWSIAGILALGIIASTATIVRIPYVWQLTHSIDFLYVFTDFTIWSTVENGVGIIASSIATLRPLFRKALDMTVRRSTTTALPPPHHHIMLRRSSSTTARRSTNSVRSTAFHCRGLSYDYDIEKGVARPPPPPPHARKVVVSGEVSYIEKPMPAYVQPGEKGKGRQTSPQRATYDCQSSTNSGWSWNSRDPTRDSRISRNDKSVEEWVENWGNSARSSRSRLMSAKRTTW
ncbi:hypothetical protein TruAng_007730 [Truncatella angustata]|nr:hypothetical protein TruAng_007730 [Truncatella angustata]